MYVYVYVRVYICTHYIKNRELIVPRNTRTCWKYYNREGRSVCSFSKLFSFMPTLRGGEGGEEKFNACIAEWARNAPSRAPIDRLTVLSDVTI